MTSEVIIDVKEKEISIALLEDKDLVEYQTEPRSASFSVGNVYIAKVRKIMPGLNACFVDVGFEKDAFLHYLDMGQHFNSYAKYIKQVNSDHQHLMPFEKAQRMPDLEKEGSVAQSLTVGQEVLVQIVKEPISTKGPRLTGEISFAGRYLVLMPFGSKVAVSSKIKSAEERARLKQLVQTLRPQNCGIIVRTVAEGLRVEELENEINVLYKRWMDAVAKMQRTTKRPMLIYEETSRSVALLRDLFNPTYENIYVNDEDVYNEVREYVSLIAPDKVGIVKQYTGKVPIFDNFNVTRQVKSGFGKTVNYAHGAYLIIEHTEAMHVVDVNSGNRARGVNGQEANALDVNLGAADELARQLRLRDMGGIIVVDFIDVHGSESKKAIYDKMRECMANDRAKYHLTPLSKFCLMEITRQRVRPETDKKTAETCPCCNGTGKIQASINLTDEIENQLKYILKKNNVSKVVIKTHPFVEAYINKGLFKSMRRQWQKLHNCKLEVLPMMAYSYMEYHFFDEYDEELM